MARKSEMAYITEKEIFASRLKSAMDMRGLNQTTLSAKILKDSGVKLQRQTISLYLNGQSKPDVERLILLRRSLGVSADYLLGFDDVWQPEIDFRAACDYTGLNGNSVECLHSWAENVKNQTDIENNVYKYFDPLERINDLFDCPEGFLFLAALARVRNVVFGGKKQLEISRDPDSLDSALKDLKVSVYELSEAARELADAKYGFEEVKKQLDKEYWNIHEEGYRAYLDSIEEAKNGEHKKD